MIFVWTLKNSRETEAEAMVKNYWIRYVTIQSSFSQDLGCKSIHHSGVKIAKKTILAPNTLKIPTISKILYLKNFNSQLQETAIFGG